MHEIEIPALHVFFDRTVATGCWSKVLKHSIAAAAAGQQDPQTRMVVFAVVALVVVSSSWSLRRHCWKQYGQTTAWGLCVCMTTADHLAWYNYGCYYVTTVVLIISIAAAAPLVGQVINTAIIAIQTMCLCMHTHTRVSMCARLQYEHAYMHTYIHACMCADEQAHTETNTCNHAYIKTCTHPYQKHMQACKQACIGTCIHTYRHTDTRTHIIHTHTHI